MIVKNNFKNFEAGRAVLKQGEFIVTQKFSVCISMQDGSTVDKLYVVSDILKAANKVEAAVKFDGLSLFNKAMCESGDAGNKFYIYRTSNVNVTDKDLSKPRPISMKESEYNSLHELSVELFGGGCGVSSTIRYLDYFYRKNKGKEGIEY